MTVYGLIPSCSYEFAYCLPRIHYVHPALDILLKQPYMAITFAECCLLRLHTAYLLLILSLCSACCHISFLRESSCLGSWYLWFSH